MSIELVVRRQYCFRAGSRKLAELLTLNVSNGVVVVNVVAVVVAPDKNVTIVVGTDDPHSLQRGGAGDPLNPDVNRTNERQNQQFQCNMYSLGIRWCEQNVIQILNVQTVTGTPGIYRIYVAALICAGIKVRQLYLGEPALTLPLVSCTGSSQFVSGINTAFIIVDPGDLQHAICVLSRLNLTFPFDESQLCIRS